MKLSFRKCEFGHALLEFTAIVPLFIGLSFVTIEFAFWYRDAQNIAFLARELANATSRHCGTESELEGCIGNAGSGFARVSAYAMYYNHEVEYMMPNVQPYILVCPWQFDSDTGKAEIPHWIPSGEGLVPACAYVLGTCPPDRPFTFQGQAYGTYGDYEPQRCASIHFFFPSPKFGSNDSSGPEQAFQDLVQMKDVTFSSEAWLYYRPLTPVGEAYFKMGGGDVIYFGTVM